LQGRKLFIWGRQQGGRHWNEWLSDGYKPYVEIQAGLLKTQLEHFVMDKQSVISWTEGYCGVRADGKKLHDPDYYGAADYLEAQFADKFAFLEEGCFDLTSQEKPTYYGSGWGAVENTIRKTPISQINCFPDDSISNVQSDWMQLLQDGALPDHDVNEPIVSYVSGAFWKELLLKKLRENWYDYYQMGVIYCADCQFDEAMTYFKRSNELQENPWSLRCMAQIQKNVLGDSKTAADNMARAVQLKPDYRPILWDCADALMADGRYSDWLAVYEGLEQQFKENGRIQFFVAVCLIKLGRLEEARALLTEDLVVDDLKEGEYSISQLWIELYRQILCRDRGLSPEKLTDSMVLQEYPLPYKLDFRMH
jgi:tetratricopeptide (TPR) repeat protein